MELVGFIKYEIKACCEFMVGSGPFVWVEGLG
jgi:hypothetical protein